MLSPFLSKAPIVIVSSSLSEDLFKEDAHLQACNPRVAKAAIQIALSAPISTPVIYTF